MNSYLECNWSSGQFINKGESVISSSAQIPSVHPATGLTVELMGSKDGYRLFYHDENRAVNMIYYMPNSEWAYGGIVSNDPPTGLALASLHAANGNISVAFPRDSLNIEIARYYSDRTFKLCKLLLKHLRIV